MKRLLRYFGCALGLLLSVQASAQETDNINNRYGPPTYTGGTVASPSEAFAIYNQERANFRSMTQRFTAPIETVYPNPATTYTRILLVESTTEPVSVTILNMNGVVVRSYEYSAGANRFDIDVSSLPEGIYALQVQERGKDAQSVQLAKINR